MKVNTLKLFLCVFFLSLTQVQAQFTERFDSQNFTFSPVWQGDTSLFRLSNSTAIPLEMRPALQLFDNKAGTAYLSCNPNYPNADSLSCTLWIKCSFTPSSNNFARFYIGANASSPAYCSKGILVSIGEFSKKISLYVKWADSLKLLIEGPPLLKSTNTATIQIRKTKDDIFELLVDTSGNQEMISYGKAFFPYEFEKNSFLGLFCQYTQSNAQKFYWDDILLESTLTDTIPPVITLTEHPTSNQIKLHFSEQLDSTVAVNKLNYQLSPDLSLDQILYQTSSITLNFLSDFRENTDYQLLVKNLIDLAGNKMEEREITIPKKGEEEDTTKKEDPHSDCLDELSIGDLLISEVLFNPLPYGSDFVEIYNKSNKTLCLENIYISTYNESGDLQKSTAVFPLGGKIGPEEYIFMTSDLHFLQMHYYVPFPEKGIEVKRMPPFPDKEGNVILCATDGKILDQFYYHENLHNPLLQKKEGVSLERRDFNIDSRDSRNWASASSSSGWATPGYKNSQHLESLKWKEKFAIENTAFSPNGDGENDYLIITYIQEELNSMCNIIIFDLEGRIIRNLVRNESLGTKGVFSWNGLNERGSLANAGGYIVFIEHFSSNGMVSKQKKAISLLKL